MVHYEIELVRMLDGGGVWMGVVFSEGRLVYATSDTDLMTVMSRITVYIRTC